MTRTEWEEFLDVTAHLYTIAEGLPLKKDDDRYTETLGRLRLCVPPTVDGMAPITALLKKYGLLRDEIERLKAWQSDARAFLEADVNCDCETGYLCSRCALLVE